MTEPQIKDIEKASNLLYNVLPKQHAQQLENAKQEYENLRRRCDHKYPDGKTAIQAGFLMDMCQICRWSDY